MKTFNYLTVIPILIFAIFGNPLYQIFSFILCESLNFKTEFEINVFQIDKQPFFLFLILIFILRFIIYALVFQYQGKIKPFKKIGRFFVAFTNSHIYQFLGLLTLWLWVIELEFNIVGFIVAPIGLVFGLPLAIITFVRLTRIPKKWDDSVLANTE